MKIGTLKQILGPLNDAGSVFMDCEVLEDFVEAASAEVDDAGDLILSDTDIEEEEEEENE